MENVMAMVHSLGKPDVVTIIKYVSNNNVLAKYKGQYCTAIFNPFVGMYYVDDKYGVITKEYAERYYNIKL